MVPSPNSPTRCSPTSNRCSRPRCEAVLETLGGHLAKGRVAIGIDDAWDQAAIGGGDTLLVEESYECAARITESGLEHTSDRDAPDVVDDVVDELIELVIARGGRVQIVPDGRLELGGPLVLLTHHEVQRPAASERT